MIVQRLREIQSKHGYLPDAALKKMAADTGVPLYRIQEVASFFAHFRQSWDKPARVEMHVCRDYTCHSGGAPAVMAELKKLAADGDVTVHGVSCLGRCDRAPAICVSRHAPTRDGEDAEHHEPHDHHPGEVAEDGSFHEFVYAGRSPAEYRKIAAQIVQGNPPPVPDLDADYTPHWNRGEWLIDPYAKNPQKLGDRTYAAVRGFLKAFPKPIVPTPKPDVAGLPDDVKKKLLEEHAKATADDLKRHKWLNRLDPSGLLGMGGAGVPAYRKWLDVWQAAGDEKYVVMNGDESEPGTFKDREILLRTPHLVVEGMVLAGLMTNATAGYIYIRHEYPEQIEACRKEIQRAVEMRACGDYIFGTDRCFPVEVFVSPGGYVCGEQSALIEAMEDKRAQPRNRPPELATNGLRDKPTLVNNVETLSWTPATILLHNGTLEEELAVKYAAENKEKATAEVAAAKTKDEQDKAKGKLRSAADDGARRAAGEASWYQKQGRPGFKGRRLFSISGDLERPGVYEVPIGMPLGESIQLCGGISGGRAVKAIAPSGPSGGLLPARFPVLAGWEKRLEEKIKSGDIPREQQKLFEKLFVDNMAPGGATFNFLAVPLDLLLFRQYGPVLGTRVPIMLGAGFAVYAEGTDVLDQALNYTQFFRNESCGKCVPCRIGSQKLTDIAAEVLARRNDRSLTRDEAKQFGDQVKDLAVTLTITSICGLGQVAPNPIFTALELFPKDIGAR
jgi:formate dehydrogenase beta subunit